MREFTYETELLIEAPLAVVFHFFSRAENLQLLTPARLHFEILTPLPIEMHLGVLIDYRLRLHGIPFRWQSEITVWQPPHRFVDLQRRGPYKKWEHEHTFEERGDSTLMRDKVRYALPGWIFAPLVDSALVRGQLEEIFRFRSEAVQQFLRDRPT